MNDSTLTQNPVIEKESSKSRFWDLFKKFVLFRLFAFLVWAWLILSYAQLPLPDGWSKYHNLLLVPYGITWVGFFFTSNWLFVITYPFYWIIFPGVLVARTAAWGSWGLRLPFKAFRATKSVAFNVFVVLTIVVSWTVTAKSTYPGTKATAALIALIAVYAILLQSFRWAANPYKPLLVATDFLSGTGRTYMEKMYIIPGLKEKGKKRDEAIKFCESILAALAAFQRPAGPFRFGLSSFTHSKVLPAFIFGSLTMYTVLALSFSLAHYYIDLAWGSIIGGLGPLPLFSTYFYFSFLTQATAIPDGVQPLSVYGQLWIIWLVVTGILLLTVLIAFFTTSLGVQSESTVAEIRSFANRAASDLVRWREELIRANTIEEAKDSSSIPEGKQD
jgi:hypothetical protein